MDASNPDLETFRKQWQEEVTARLKGKEGASGGSRPSAPSERAAKPTATVALPPSVVPKDDTDPIDGISTQAYHDLEDKEDGRRLGTGNTAAHPSTQPLKEPKSALEHYERAVEREDQGNLGDSLKLYRQAFRVSPHSETLYMSQRRRLIA
ncbi:MAG: hypothetical protein L6R39_003553 [Caloplaca ligustica]|nr:MAG: hypothetical protein L6R39_003553 [Caloplaca ligustica]